MTGESKDWVRVVETAGVDRQPPVELHTGPCAERVDRRWDQGSQQTWRTTTEFTGRPDGSEMEHHDGDCSSAMRNRLSSRNSRS